MVKKVSNQIQYLQAISNIAIGTKKYLQAIFILQHTFSTKYVSNQIQYLLATCNFRRSYGVIFQLICFCSCLCKQYTARQLIGFRTEQNFRAYITCTLLLNYRIYTDSSLSIKTKDYLLIAKSHQGGWAANSRAASCSAGSI